MKKALLYIVFIFLIGGLFFLYGFSSARNSAKKVHDISIEFDSGVNEFLTYEMVNKLLIQNKEIVSNKAKSIIDLQGLEYAVVSNPYIEKANVFLTINGSLKATVKQRTPIARINTTKESYYLDKQGVKMPLSVNYSARVMLVSGEILAIDYQEIKEFVNQILADDFLRKEIVGIEKTATNEFVLRVRSGKQRIEFGKLVDVNVKFIKLKAFYNTTFVDKTIEKYKTINLKYHNQVVCTK